MWKFVRERQPHFVANSVLPDFVTGPPFIKGKSADGPSFGVLKAIYDGSLVDLSNMLYPQYTIDAKDNAKLHVAALVQPDVQGERVFGYAHRKNWTTFIAKFREWYPEHTWPGGSTERDGGRCCNDRRTDPPRNEGVDLANVTAQPRAEELLRWLGQPGWRPMDESLKECINALR